MRKIQPKTISKAMEEPRRKVYPSFHIGLKHLPEAKKWEIGRTYKLSLQLKMTGISIDEDYSDASFDITGIEVLSNPKKGMPIPKISRY